MFHERIELIKYLIDKGADFNKTNLRNKSPYDLAVLKSNEDIIKIFELYKTRKCYIS